MERCGPNVPVSMLVLRDACSSSLTELIRRELLRLSSTWVAGSSSSSLFEARSCLPICPDYAQQLEFIHCFLSRGNNKLMHRFSYTNFRFDQDATEVEFSAGATEPCYITPSHYSPSISDQSVRKWPAKSKPLKDEPSKAKSIRFNRPRQHLA